MEKFVRLISMAPLFLLLWLPFVFAGHDYGQALSKSFLFYKGQRSSYLPKSQRVTWRADSGLQDGTTDHYCWQRPEDMTTDRRAYKIDPSNPGLISPEKLLPPWPPPLWSSATPTLPILMSFSALPIRKS